MGDERPFGVKEGTSLSRGRHRPPEAFQHLQKAQFQYVYVTTFPTH